MLVKVLFNSVLTLRDYSRGPELLKSSGIIDFQNGSNTSVSKQLNLKFLAPMSYISLCATHSLRIPVRMQL